MFSWIPIHQEATRKILAAPKPQKELLATLREMEQQGLKVISLRDQDPKGSSHPLGQIDPFTFLATFNRRITPDNRRANWQFVKRRWNLQSEAPQDFSGIPTVDSRRSWFFAYAFERKEDDIDALWKLASQAIKRPITEIDEELFKRCCKVRMVGIAKLTIGLFWINPKNFLPCDKKTSALGENHGVSTSPKDFQSYLAWLREISTALGNDFPKVSHEAELAASGAKYWWLNANLDQWRFEGLRVGGRQTYTSHTKNGNKRQVYTYFKDVKRGDFLVGCATSSQPAVVAICRITRSLHDSKEGERIEFEVVAHHKQSVPYEALKGRKELEKCEPLIINPGSLFKLRKTEYEVICDLINEANSGQVKKPTYTKERAMRELFLPEGQFANALEALREKKNLVLQGPPGVGKTFVARRLAKVLIGTNDPQCIEMIQFHQSYSYEDFIQGFRPTAKGSFKLKDGIFHQFCRRAQRDEGKSGAYVFIIDEINRGNLSKIFGELMMLVEPDKRGREFSIPLVYASDSDDKFYIPANVHLIGTMNTADRSLAMVDYALRRRFRFINLRPEYSSSTFKQFLADRGAEPTLVQKVVGRMAALNRQIADDTKNLGRGYEIGHSYFCPGDAIRPDDAWFRRVVDLEIVPLLQEYWLDDDHKVKKQREMLLS